jgi:hypothetical protein
MCGRPRVGHLSECALLGPIAHLRLFGPAARMASADYYLVNQAARRCVPTGNHPDCRPGSAETRLVPFYAKT